MDHQILQPSATAITQCVELLIANQCVVLPTETVYGLAANANVSTAVAKIYHIKNRPEFNPLIVHVKNIQAAQDIAIFDQDALKLATEFWPGPLTLVLPLKQTSGLSPLVTAGLNSVAIRCPQHAIFQEILHALDFPLAAPSANPSQHLSATSAKNVSRGFINLTEELTIIDGGNCYMGIESTIVDLTESPAVILRAGPLTIEKIQTVCSVSISSDPVKLPYLKSPGLMARHYAPRSPLRLNARHLNPSEVMLGFGLIADYSNQDCLNLSPKGDLIEAAHNLFNYLHILDDKNAAAIAVSPIPSKDIGIAINDRLKRAAHKNEI